jgi:hypothetical protein
VVELAGQILRGCRLQGDNETPLFDV